MIVETASPLIGSAPDEELFDNIVKDIESYNGVLGTHDAIMHSYGPTKIFMTIHVEVDGYENMFKSHDMIDNIEKEVGNKYGISLTIHMDPVDTKNKEIPILKNQIEEILPKIHDNLSFHDLRVVAGPTHTNVIFDLVVPNDKDLDKAKIAHEIRKEIKKIKPEYFAVINFDEKYVK
jgi:divalent metal cation (Fe/Co/Zn/Cd) transporter